MNTYLLKDNQLSYYALSCGYLQQATDTKHNYDYSQKVELSKRHDIFEVFYMDYKTLETEKFYFDSLTVARKEWKKLVKKYELKAV